MNYQRTLSRSPYMEFAKLRSGARYNLASSGMANLPLSALKVSLEEFEINGPNGYGYLPLREVIANRYRVPVECVVPAMGTSMANYFALAATVNPGEGVLIERPTYGLILDTARYLGLEIRRFDRPAELDYQVDFANLERNLTSRTKLIVLCNLHNPTGAMLSNASLRRVGELAKQAGARVLVDEVYLEMLWENTPSTSFHLDPDVFIVTDSLTKAYGLSGIRCGWVLAPAEIAERIWRIHDLHAATNAYPAELLSVAAFQQLESIAQLQKARLEENRRLLRETLSQQNLLQCFWPDHGTVVFPKVNVPDVQEFCDRLRSGYDISVVPGEFFEDPQRVRIGVGGETEAVRESLERLRCALTDLSSSAYRHSVSEASQPLPRG